MLLLLTLIDSTEERSKFEQIYYAYERLLLGIAYKILNNRADAEDAVQNAFISIIENLHKIDEPVCSKTKAFAVTIVERKALDIYRYKHRHNHEIIDDDFTDVFSLDLSESVVAATSISNAITKLPQSYREAILYRYYINLTVPEIAKITKTSEASVYKTISRAKSKLEQLIEEENR